MVISQEMLMNLIRNLCFEITPMKLLPHLPGVSELISSPVNIYRCIDGIAGVPCVIDALLQ